MMFILVPSINLVDNNAYLNGNLKRKRPENEETKIKPTTKDERVSICQLSSISEISYKLLFTSCVLKLYNITLK